MTYLPMDRDLGQLARLFIELHDALQHHDAAAGHAYLRKLLPRELMMRFVDPASAGDREAVTAAVDEFWDALRADLLPVLLDTLATEERSTRAQGDLSEPRRAWAAPTSRRSPRGSAIPTGGSSAAPSTSSKRCTSRGRCGRSDASCSTRTCACGAKPSASSPPGAPPRRWRWSARRSLEADAETRRAVAAQLGVVGHARGADPPRRRAERPRAPAARVRGAPRDHRGAGTDRHVRGAAGPRAVRQSVRCR